MKEIRQLSFAELTAEFGTTEAQALFKQRKTWGLVDKLSRELILGEVFTSKEEAENGTDGTLE